MSKKDYLMNLEIKKSPCGMFEVYLQGYYHEDSRNINKFISCFFSDNLPEIHAFIKESFEAGIFNYCRYELIGEENMSMTERNILVTLVEKHNQRLKNPKKLF